MKILSILAITFLYLEIFSQQTSGASLLAYKCESSSSDCLTISDEKANWDTAYATCVLQGGELIDFSNSLVNQIVQANDGGEYYWTGYRRVGDTPAFLSTDGTISNDCYSWKNIAGVDCVGYDGESGKYLSLECDTNNIVVCHIEGNKCYALAQQYGDICSSSVFSSGIPTESSLRDFTVNFSLTTGDIINFYGYPQGIVITQLRANTQTQIPIYYSNTIQIGADTFQEDTTLVIHSTENTVQFNNASFILRSNLVTIYASNNSTGNLNIFFKDFNYADYGKYLCVYLSSDGDWSTDGVDTHYCRLNRTIQCTTKLQTNKTIALETNFYSRGYDSTKYILYFITYFSLPLPVLLLFISVLLLLSSVVIFIVSGKKFFSHGINILHFNNTLSLFLAIVSLSVYVTGVIVYKATPECFAIIFFLHFLWTNVFLSSLSIAIVVFYTIWIVSINHTARKLYKYLIPIGWGVSLVWSLASTAIKIFTVDKCDSKILCLFDSNFNIEIGWSFLGPIITVLLINTTLLILSLIKIWSVLRKQNSHEGELKRLRRIAIGGILLIPALGLPFISLTAILFYDSPDNELPSKENIERILDNNLIFFIIFLTNSPIGIVHFIFITCQIKETILRKYCCCCRRITPARIAHSLHLNIARKSPKAKQETPNDVIPDSVPNTESTVYSNNSNEPIN